MQEEFEENLIDEYVRAMHLQSIDPLPISLINESYIGSRIKPLNPVESACFFSGLMLKKELASNHNMLNALIFAILGFGSGKKKLSRKLANNLFLSLRGTYYRRMEDPTEDVFVSLVYFRNRNYKIIQGIWADNDFYIQIFLDALKDIQPSTRTSKLFASIEALLKISDLMISKSGLERYCVGNELPLSEIPGALLNEINSISNKVKFSKEEFVKNGINFDDISMFIYPLNQRVELLSSSVSSCTLEVKPIIEFKENFYFMLPSSIGIALKHLIFDFFISSGNKIALRTLMQRIYLERFSSGLSILNIRNKEAFNPIVNNSGIIIGQFSVSEIDIGRFVHAVLLFDDFDGFETSGHSGISPNALESTSFVENNIRSVYETATGLKGFREGLTLIISCGWARAIALPQILPQLENWSTEFISAPDITTFSNISGMNSIKFWQFIKSKRVAENTGIHIHNVNGLLNLYAWAESNNYHIVPHKQIPDELTINTLEQYHMLVESNFLLDIRSKVRLNWDAHNETSPDGEVIHVKRLGSDYYFEEDKLRPVYASSDDVKKGRLVGLVKSKKANYWNILHMSSRESAFMNHELWQALCYWIHKLSKLFDEKYTFTIPSTIVWKWHIEGILPTEVQSVPSYEEMLLLTESTVAERDNNLYITSTFKVGFLQGFHHESNQGERAMVHTFLKSILSYVLSPELQEDTSEEIINTLFFNPNAKSFHVLQALHYRDYVAQDVSKPIFISELETATAKIGLGWLARSPELGSKVEGVNDCTKYLNDLVLGIWLNLKEKVQIYDKTSLLDLLLRNHEAIADDTKRWERTFKAVLESHDLKENVYQKVVDEIGRRNSSLLGTRILTEIALCESKVSGGIIPGEIDISEMLVYAAFLFNFAGWSDTIKYEMIPAEITIAPAGDVLLDHSFNDSVIEPYGRASQENLLQDAIENYSDYYEVDPESAEAPALVDDFDKAWVEEYGFSIDEGAKILDAIFQIGIQKSKLVFSIVEEELLLSLESMGISKNVSIKFLEAFTLSERGEWLTAPQGFNLNDIFPWRFRRRLSIVVRPILKLGTNLIITPGLLSDGFEYVVRGCLYANFDETFYRSKLMRSWIGGKRNLAGHQFNKDVVDAFKARGWKAEPELKLTKLLKKKLDKDYGDIDVVAWNTNSGEVLLIECKDLEFAKNPSEIAKQTYEFRGVLRENGKPDRLLKHMERIRVASENIEALKEFTGISGEIVIKPALLFSRLVPMKFLHSDNLKNFEIFIFKDLSIINLSEDK